MNTQQLVVLKRSMVIAPARTTLTATHGAVVIATPSKDAIENKAHTDKQYKDNYNKLNIH